MTQNLVNCFIVTENKVLGLFISQSWSPKYFFGANLVSKLEKVLFKIKLDTEGYSRLPILNSTIIFLNLLKLQSASFRMKIRRKRYSRGADSRNLLDGLE